MAALVEFDAVQKSYRKSRLRAPLQALVPGAFGDRLRGDVHHAVDDVSFRLAEGDSLGIIGRNGAGKSTILKLVAKVVAPTSGEVRVAGTTAALIELGAGFHPEMTGRENVEFSAAVLGMTRRTLQSRLPRILEFAGVDEYLDTPVKHYSSGMLARLGFAVASHLDADVLVVDEVLAVGDGEFQKRCHDQIAGQRGRGAAVLYVTHQLWTLPIVCDDAILLEHGRIALAGTPEAVIERYEADGGAPATHWVGGIFDEVALDRRSLRPGEPLGVEIAMTTSAPAPTGYLLVSIVAPGHRVVTSVTSADAGIDFSEPGARRLSCRLERVPIAVGAYELYVSYFEHADRPMIEDHRRIHFVVEGEARDRATYGDLVVEPSWTSS
jgi:ABC-type polysaccharide/polyol phosphate transport system ATPase subunit